MKRIAVSTGVAVLGFVGIAGLNAGAAQAVVVEAEGSISDLAPLPPIHYGQRIDSNNVTSLVELCVTIKPRPPECVEL